MANDKGREPEEQQNISEVLEMLRQSYVEDEKEDKSEEPSYEGRSEDVSYDVLQQMLRRQFMTEDGAKDDGEKADESYEIDEEFLEEASAELEEPEAEAEEEIEEELEEELPWDEEPEEDLEEELIEDDDNRPLTAEELALIQAFAELDDDDEDNGFAIDEEEAEETEETEEIEESEETDEDDELPWDEEPEEEIEETEEIEEDAVEEIDEDLIPVRVKDEEFRFMDMPIPERSIEDIVTPLCEDEDDKELEEADEELTFEQLVTDEEENDGIELLDIPAEEETDGDDDLTFDQLESVDATEDDVSYTVLDLSDAPTEEITEEPIEEPVEAEEAEEPNEPVEDAIEEQSAEETEEQKPALSSAELSILLQFGCDDEILEIATDEDIEKLAISDSIRIIDEEQSVSSDYGMFSVDEDDLSLDIREEEPDIHQTLEEKVIAIYDAYPKKRGAALLRLLATGCMAILLFLYEALPLLGVQLPGIMDRKEYFLAYVLIGMQLLVLALLPSAKQLIGGVKRMFSRSADEYSMLAVLAIVILVYDAFIMWVKIGAPQVFHFMVAAVAACLSGAECVRLTYEMNNFRYFFTDTIERSENDEIDDEEISTEARFTLKRSSGKGSTADKMYGGGLDPTKNVYVPINVSSAAGYFSANEDKGRKSRAPMILMLPAMIISLIMGVVAILVNGGEDIWIGVGTVLVSLALTLPLGFAFSSWLPFAIFNAGCQKRGFSFVNENAADQYSSCNVFVFRDMHVFEKCAPKSVNLATYDATSKEVLIGCLAALYSEIGGPLANVFSLGSTNETSFGSCKLRRVAKSGVEAVVGANYSVLLGNEQFMARYGINFPGITFKHKGDEIYSICLSINGRATARIIVKYMVNEMFEMFAKRLEEDGIYCAIETFDPMVSTRLLAKLRGADKPPLSVVHLGIEDYEATSRQEARPLGEDGAKLGLVAKRSRLNLAVATTCAKKMKDIRKKVNLLSFLAALLGVGISFLFTMLGWMEALNEFVLLLYWALLFAAMVAIVLTSLPQKERFSLDVFKKEESIENMADSILDIASDK